MPRKVLLIIMDGWGIGDKTKKDAIFSANTYYTKMLSKAVPNSYLLCTGEDVGLPAGQMGNSEVGHLNLGAGRIVYQDFVRINKAIQDKSIEKNKVITDAFEYALKNDKQVHFIGLIGNGGVHSVSEHLLKLCEIATNFGLKKIFIHALTDGRDTDPHSGLGFMKEILERIANTPCKVATLAGRYYTMDRDKRWERIREGYDLMVHGKGKKYRDVLKAIEDSYEAGVTDEFIKPVVIVDENDNPLTKIEENDVVICFNFRTDRLRQITTALTQLDIPDYNMKTIPLYYLTMTRYDERFKNVKVIFDKQDLSNTIGEVLSINNKKQLRIAETEKYAHVTFFFSGGREEKFEGEDRILIPSPKVPTYDLKPSMSAYEVKDAVINEIRKNKYDFICLNFANADMVGHTGVYEAIVEAVETVDKCVKEVVEEAVKNDYAVILTADHGNSDYVLNDDGTPNTAHSMNPVPIYIINTGYNQIKPGRLCDVAPTILHIMQIPIPPEMDGQILVS